ncbi:MAG: Nodulation efficiency protein NfeD [Candidatus Solibacter sp.]|jgi:membrane-bound serine protease (ClpP class)|nr:Nodulation efficiency protein NfeD [Candidatus Solibacter sp.]
MHDRFVGENKVYSEKRLRVRAVFTLALALATRAVAASPRVIAVDVDGMVHPITTEIISGALSQAKNENAALVVIRLNTPGGLMEAMRASIEKIVASPVPVVTYVAPAGARAASAGFFLLEAGDVAAMSPATATGAAHPVLLTGEMDPAMKQKVENDAAAYLRSITEKHGRNSALAETAVRESRSFTEREALDQKLIDLIAPGDRQLLASLEGRVITRFDGSTAALHTAGAAIVEYQRTLRQKIISAIADPNIALILLFIGALGLYVEFSSPGLILPGVLGGILVLLGLSALSVLPLNWLGAALMVLAFALFVLEVKFTSHGILGAGGALALVLGAVMLVDSPVPELRIHWSTAIGLALPWAAITIFLLTIAARARRNKVETGSEGMIGLTGTAMTNLAPMGKVFVHGEYWDAIAVRPADAGAHVRVTAIDGLKLTVEPE